MIEITVDGKKIKVVEGNYLLKELKKNGIKIPSLCDHEAVEPWGGCRLCLVEITKEEWKGWSKIVASCLFPIEKDLIVYTASKDVLETRKEVIKLLLARCPETPLILDLAKEYGIEKIDYKISEKPTDCILCGLCTRICETLGMSAIALMDRGIGREVSPPLGMVPPDCIGCLACAYICPTNYIKFKERGYEREIWGKTFKLKTCSKCSKPIKVTEEEAKYFSKKQGVSEETFNLCDNCKNEFYGEKFKTLVEL